MDRLFPIDEALTAEHAAVLEVIAVDMGCSTDAVYIGAGASGPAVFYEDAHGNNGTRCACDLEGAYWQECKLRAVANAFVTALLARLRAKPDRGPA